MSEGTEQNDDPHLQRLRALLNARADAEHATYHKAYHKSALEFHGLRSAQMREVFREVFPTRQAITREAALPLTAQLWQSGCWEESMLAISLLERVEPQLGMADLPLLHGMSRQCEGWAQLDTLTCNVISRMALRLSGDFYDEIMPWGEDPVMWTRRAGILVHVQPARKRRINEAYFWPALEARLDEREFFIRKAVGWALREACAAYPREVHAFLLRVGDRASGLTRREGARKLPPELRRDILGN